MIVRNQVPFTAPVQILNDHLMRIKNYGKLNNELFTWDSGV